MHSCCFQRKPEEGHKQFDTDDSGFIDFDEFYVMLKELGMKMTEAKAKGFLITAMKMVLVKWTLTELKLAAQWICDGEYGLHPNQPAPQDAFEMFDDDNSGYLDEDEFLDVLQSIWSRCFGHEQQDHLLKSMIRRFRSD